MVDIDTFLTTLYVMVDDFCKSRWSPKTRPGPQTALTLSEVITLALFSRWRRFANERDFYRWADRHLRSTFPHLPDRSQFNRQVRHAQEAIVGFFLFLVEELNAQQCAYEALDATGVPVRDARRRGEGWLFGQVDIGNCRRIGWFEGFYLLLSVNPTGVITGFGFGTASTKDQPLAETFFAARAQPQPRLPSVGRRATGYYVVDKGFEGRENHQRWRDRYGAPVVCPPKKQNRVQWPKALRRWAASIRQIVETVNEKLHRCFGLRDERPHHLTGFQARLAARIALHNFCIWLNDQLGQPRLAFADLIAW